ncbi:hypothetical protein FRC03_010310 [Tulasnella sp. 419]|nr:hypothetical protein FRC02_011281 [Tulasnella sp. 418]KAG8957263.1 hypothetical protein FRC03_010310 [Tulasnella sp. 419]
MDSQQDGLAPIAGGRGPVNTPGGTTTRIPPGLQAKLAALAQRSPGAASFSGGPPTFQAMNNSSPGPSSTPTTKIPPAIRSRLPNGSTLPPPHLHQAVRQSPQPPDVDAAAKDLGAKLSLNPSTTPSPAQPPQLRAPNGLAARRAGNQLKLASLLGTPKSSAPRFGAGASAAGLGAGRPTLDDSEQVPSPSVSRGSSVMDTPFSNFNKIVDPSGALVFGGKATLHASGVDFSNGTSFSISMSELELQEELGKGNYGTVMKVFHKPTKVVMAMKEIRLELDDSKLNSILVELDILHRASCPEIVDFFGAFFIESCVYYCMEYMDAGSLDTLIGTKEELTTTEKEALEANGADMKRSPTGDFDTDVIDPRPKGGPEVGGLPEDVMARVVGSMVRGLRFLKEKLNVMHRDVKPTNVLLNLKGQVKLCDFGVSGQLEKSMAKTNIGCQSYMAPERIHGEAQNKPGTYSVSSDVWSLGLSVIELGLGKYPYPPEMYSNVFAQLTAIVHGPSPRMPAGYSEEANDFVDRCVGKEPSLRPSYQELLEHPWLIEDAKRDVDMVGWTRKAVARREAARQAAKERGTTVKPAGAPGSSSNI